MPKRPEIRRRRETFISELLSDLTVYPYTKETALLAGKLDGEEQSRGVVIPFSDLLTELLRYHLASRC